MTTFKAIIVGAGLLALSATAALAQNCEVYATDYANRTVNVGGSIIGSGLIGAGIGAAIGSGSGEAGKGAAIGGGIGAGLAAVGSSQQWQAAHDAALRDCLARSGGYGQPVATGNACDVGSEAWFNYCDGRPGIGRGGHFKSFNPADGTYLGYDGVRHFCLPSYC